MSAYDLSQILMTVSKLIYDYCLFGTLLYFLILAADMKESPTTQTEELNTTIKDLFTEMRGMLQEQEKRFESLEEINKHQTGQLHAVEDTLSRVNTNITEKIENLLAELETKKEIIRSNKAKIMNLTKDLDGKDAYLDNLKQDFEKFRKEHADCFEKIADLEKKNTALGVRVQAIENILSLKGDETAGKTIKNNFKPPYKSNKTNDLRTKMMKK